jgi:hypothetical protein
MDLNIYYVSIHSANVAVTIVNYHHPFTEDKHLQRHTIVNYHHPFTGDKHLQGHTIVNYICV